MMCAHSMALYPCQLLDNFNRAVRTLPPREVSIFFVVHTADMKTTDSAQAIVYLTTDVPRTRAYSVNYNIYTPHVRFLATVPHT